MALALSTASLPYAGSEMWRRHRGDGHIGVGATAGAIAGISMLTSRGSKLQDVDVPYHPQQASTLFQVTSGQACTPLANPL